MDDTEATTKAEGRGTKEIQHSSLLFILDEVEEDDVRGRFRG